MQIVYWNLIIFNLLYNLTISDIFICIYTWKDIMILLQGLSLRAGGRGFSLATKRVAPGYFYRKIEEK